MRDLHRTDLMVLVGWFDCLRRRVRLQNVVAVNAWRILLPSPFGENSGIDVIQRVERGRSSQIRAGVGAIVRGSQVVC